MDKILILLALAAGWLVLQRKEDNQGKIPVAVRQIQEGRKNVEKD
jgi:hypothetical protein